MTYPGPATFPGTLDFPGAVQSSYILCQRIDSGSMAAELIDSSLISDRFRVGPVPDWIPCRQVMADALNPGCFILVGWLYSPPVFDPPASD
jgi:hypothetical protein